ncbi:hypothetical protein H5410_002751, partial [Solanum commersonii]
FKRLFVAVKKCVAKDPLSAVNQDRRTTQRSTLLFGTSPFSFCLQHLRNIRRGCRPFGDTPNGLGDRQAVFSTFFQPLCSFLLNGIHVLSLNSNT